MTLNSKKSQVFLALTFFCLLFLQKANASYQEDLRNQYRFCSASPSDIYQHVPMLKNLSSECSSVVEIGLRGMVSTWGILQGLSESPSPSKSYLGIDIAYIDCDHARFLAEKNGIEFQFMQENSMCATIPLSDFLFIDSLHTYAHLSYELERYCDQINKYIAMHDTSAPWGSSDDSVYYGDRSEYPDWIDKSKRGLWPAVVDFLERHPEWELQARYLNNHGFTILKRVSE